MRTGSFLFRRPAHNNDARRYRKSASQNRPSLLNHVLAKRTASACSCPVNNNVAGTWTGW